MNPILGGDFSEKLIKHVEEKYDAKFVIESCMTSFSPPDKPGDPDRVFHENQPAAFFYTKEAHEVSGSNYFCIRYIRDELMISSGACLESQEIIGVVADNGDIIHSRYRHDFRASPDGSVTIDGGRDYYRGSIAKTVKYIIKDGVVTIGEH